MSDPEDEPAIYSDSSDDDRHQKDSFFSNERRSRQIQQFHDSEESRHHEDEETTIEAFSHENNPPKQPEEEIDQRQQQQHNFHKHHQESHDHIQPYKEEEPKQIQISVVQDSIDSHPITIQNEVTHEQPKEQALKYPQQPQENHEEKEQQRVEQHHEEHTATEQTEQILQNDVQRLPEVYVPQQVEEVIHHQQIVNEQHQVSVVQQHEEQIVDNHQVHEPLPTSEEYPHHQPEEQVRIPNSQIIQNQHIDNNQQIIQQIVQKHEIHHPQPQKVQAVEHFIDETRLKFASNWHKVQHEHHQPQASNSHQPQVRKEQLNESIEEKSVEIPKRDQLIAISIKKEYQQITEINVQAEKIPIIVGNARAPIANQQPPALSQVRGSEMISETQEFEPPKPQNARRPLESQQNKPRGEKSQGGSAKACECQIM